MHTNIIQENQKQQNHIARDLLTQCKGVYGIVWLRGGATMGEDGNDKGKWEKKSE